MYDGVIPMKSSHIRIGACLIECAQIPYSSSSSSSISSCCCGGGGGGDDDYATMTQS